MVGEVVVVGEGVVVVVDVLKVVVVGVARGAGGLLQAAKAHATANRAQPASAGRRRCSTAQIMAEQGGFWSPAPG